MTLTVVDASVVVAALEPGDAHHETASAALTERAAAGTVVLPVSAYAESLVHPMQQGEESAREVDAFLARSALQVEGIGVAAGREAARLRAAHGLALADALVLGFAADARADAVLTADRDWATVSDRVVIV